MVKVRHGRAYTREADQGGPGMESPQDALESLKIFTKINEKLQFMPKFSIFANFFNVLPIFFNFAKSFWKCRFFHEDFAKNIEKHQVSIHGEEGGKLRKLAF